MKMKSKNIQKILTIVLFCGFAFWGLLESALAQEPKVHVLLVWATNDPNTVKSATAAKEVFESTIAGAGIRGKYPGETDEQYASCMTASITSLSGNDAHPRNILAHCERMAQEAGPNDALFVYILCHGVSIYLDGHTNDPEYLIHVLSPVATGNTDAGLDIRNIGIKRYSILKAMKSRKHRLDVLITDSCSTLSRNPVKPPKQPSLDEKRLSYLLKSTSGTINWNSSNPLGGYNRKGETAIGTPNGTLFTKAFLDVALSKARSGESQELFFNDLKAELIKVFKEEKRKARESEGDDILWFSNQDQQTLTKFDVYGRPLDENDRPPKK